MAAGQAAAADKGRPTLADKVRALGSPALYSPPPERVDVKETHMSWVFLAGGHVYKLKKPVRNPFLDFTTLAARDANAREEVRLNRRLAPDVYLGVVKLTEEAPGRLALGGRGRVVDWLVHMRRLPERAMLDAAIARRDVPPERIDALAARLARFYREAERPATTPEAYADRFVREQDENRAVLLGSAAGPGRDEAASVIARADAALARVRPLLMERVRGGHVVEGHGDLRPEHVCLLDPPLVIDCLEFNRELRLLDPFDELAFLGFECTRLGAPWIGPRLFDHCAEVLGDRPPAALVAFYTAFRGLVRARLALAHLLDPHPATPGKWRPQAREYLRIAARALKESVPPSPPA